MNMIRSDLERLELDTKMIESSKVIDGYIYLSEASVNEPKRRKSLRKVVVFFAFLSLMIVLLTPNQHHFIPLAEVVKAQVPPSPPVLNPPTLADMLSNTAVEYLSPEALTSFYAGMSDSNSTIPDDMAEFIAADNVFTTIVQHISRPSSVMLEEVNLSAAEMNIDHILMLADKLFKRDRLTLPPDHNAFVHYEKVLSVHPKHTEALAGVKKIVDRYLHLAEKAIAKNEQHKVPDLISKAYSVGEKYMDVSIIVSRFAEYLSETQILADQTAENRKDFVKTIPNHNNDKHTQNSLRLHADAVLKNDNEVASTAYSLYKQGDIDASITMLKKFISSSEIWGESNELLLKIYLTHKKVIEAETMIYKNKALDAYQFAEKSARVMLTRGDTESALNMLLAYTPEFLNNQTYYILLASLYHKVGNYQQSVYWYRQLLGADYKNPRLWLGLSVSLDALGQKEDALKALEYVHLYAKNRPVIERYISEQQLVLNEYPENAVQSN